MKCIQKCIQKFNTVSVCEITQSALLNIYDWRKHDGKKFDTTSHVRALLTDISKASDVYITSSHRRCSVKKRVVKYFTNFTGKHLCWIIFFYEKENPTQVFSCEICEIFKNIYFEEHLRTTAYQLLKKTHMI